MNARLDGLPKAYPRVYGYGITRRDRSKPFLVKFRRNKKQIVVGSFATLEEAQTAATNFLRDNPK